MADMVDMAQELEAEHLAHALQLARRPVPAGAPGTCDGCGEAAGRIVDGRCAPCREPRLPRGIRRN